MKRKHILGILLVAACLILAAGCSDETTDPGGGGDDPVSADIGPQGGALTSADGDFTLTVPAGALGQTTTLTIDRRTGADVPDELAAEGVTVAYEIGPAGTAFQVPATVSLDVTGAKRGGRPEAGDLQVLLEARIVEISLPETQELGIDWDTGLRELSGLISETGSGGAMDYDGLDVNFPNVPDGAISGIPFELRREIARDPSSVLEAALTFRDRSHTIRDNAVTCLDNEVPLGQLAAAPIVYMATYDSDCPDDTDGVLVPALELEDYTLTRELGSESTYTLVFRKVIACVAGSGDPTSEPAIVTSPFAGPEGLARIRPGWAGMLAVLFVILLASANGWGAVDPRLGAALITIFVLNGFVRYGVLALSHPSSEKQGAYVDAAFSYGPEGARLTHYQNDVEDWGMSQIIGLQAHITDAVPFGNATVVPGLVFVNNTTDQVHFVVYDAVDDAFEVSPEALAGSEFPGLLAGTLFSACAATADGPVLAVANGEPGQLFLHPRDGAVTATFVGNVMDQPRRVRHAGNIAVISHWEGGVLTIVLWDGVSDTATVAGTVQVGWGGSIGIDVMDLGDGTVGVCSTGYLDDSYSVTVIDDTGTVVSNTTTAAPGGCTGPGHAIWARDGTRNILFSCQGSDQIVTVASGL